MELLLEIKGGALSGGTVASLLGSVFDENKEDKKALQDPYGLDPTSSSR